MHASSVTARRKVVLESVYFISLVSTFLLHVGPSRDAGKDLTQCVEV